jgi:DNA repair protein RadD
MSGKGQDADYLSITDASDYIGVSIQTLRRWDANGRLKPVRHPSSGYRFYKRADLEPFRLEYRRAEMQPEMAAGFFQSTVADIENNERLREPQRHAHRAVRQHFAKSNEPAIIQIPVGCGKTGLIATLPLGIAQGRVLVITPNLTIRRGVAESLDFSNTKNFWRRTGAIHDFSAGPYTAVLDGIDANLHDCNESHFVITNIQQLASAADRWLPQFPPNFFDMILIDEGHHNVAPSWTKVFERFPNAKVISLTATPFRSDGVRPIGKVIYRYPFARAMVNGYIKQIHSTNVAPSELYFTYRDDVKRHTLEEVLDLREEAWFRRGVALSRECNEHIVDASLKHLNIMRDRSGFRHQLIAVACSVDHAKEVRSLYEQRGYKSHEIHSDMDREKQEAVITSLVRGKLDVIVQVQMLGEGFDHPPLSIAAIFRPFRSLSPYIQFIGRVMRVVREAKPDDPDNHAFIVSHVGLNNDEQWKDFREIDFDDQKLIHEWIKAEGAPDDEAGEPQARRFDDAVLVDSEILGDFIRQSFLDPDDKRVLDEFLSKSLGAGLKLGDLISRDELRAKIKTLQKEQGDSSPSSIPIQPQRRRVEARKRLNERAKSVANRVLSELQIGGAGREVGSAIKSVRGQPNRMALIELMNRRINVHLKIDSGERNKISADQAEDALAALDMIGDSIRDEVREIRGV